jgi:alpha-glucuronidase
VLDHWDNLDGTIERGYAGHSIFDWHKIPDYRTRVMPCWRGPTPRSASTACR